MADDLKLDYIYLVILLMLHLNSLRTGGKE